MPAQLKYIPHYTYQDYCQWEGRWELIDGVPVAMSPLPLPQHQRIGGRLFKIFDDLLMNQCGDCVAYPPIDWLVKEDTVVQPDFLVVCDKITKAYLDFSPVLVAEVLSPSTALKDRNAKLSIYESQGVKYYLILDITAKKLEVYQLIDRKYQPIAVSPASFDFNLHDNCSITVSFAELWT